MENIIRMGDMNQASGWEYLGVVVQNGMEFIALSPLDGTGRECFFFSDAEQYRRVADMETECFLTRKLRQAGMEDARNRLREAR